MQTLLPLFKDGVNLINSYTGYERRGKKIYYYIGRELINFHEETDRELFQCITSQLIINGNVKQSEIVRAFKVSAISVKRAVKKLRKVGLKKFFAERNVRGGVIITEEIIEKIENRLSEQKKLFEIAEELKIKADTIKKAIQSGRIKKNSKFRK